MLLLMVWESHVENHNPTSVAFAFVVKAESLAHHAPPQKTRERESRERIFKYTTKKLYTLFSLTAQ